MWDAGEGNLYGTTADGGVDNYGTVLKVGTTVKEKVLCSFTDGADGEAPAEVPLLAVPILMQVLDCQTQRCAHRRFQYAVH